MSDASELIAQQMAAAGVVPSELSPVGSASKIYVDQQDAILQNNINGSVSLAASAQQTADTAISRAKMGFSQVNDIPATAYGDRFYIVQGVGITVSTNPDTKEVTITATGNAAPAAHASTHIPGGSDPIQTATTTRFGLTQHYNATDSTSTSLSGTANAVRLAKVEAQAYTDAKTWQKFKLTEDSGLSKDISSQDLNQITQAGFYVGGNMINAPNNSFYYVQVIRNANPADPYCIQILRGMLNDSSYERRNQSGVWGSFSQDFRLLNSYITLGSGSPEGILTKPVGSLYLRLDGGAGTTLYVKQSGTGNVGWVAK